MKKIIILLFIVLSISLKAAVQISSEGVNASEPVIGLDNNGNAVALWVENGSILSKNCPLSGNWGSATTLSSSGSASSPDLVVDENGNATAIWIDAGSVLVSSQPYDGNWTTPVTLSSSSNGSTPHLAVDVTGNVVAIWNVNGSIQSATLSLNSTWPSSPDILTTSGCDSPEIAIGNNNVVAVWHEVVSSVDTIYSSNKALEGLWGTPQSISSSSYNSINPQISVDSYGNAIAVWFRYVFINSQYSNVIVQANYQTLGNSWLSPVDISTPGFLNPSNLYVAIGVDASGNAQAFWNNSLDGSTFNLESSFKPFDGSWNLPRQLIAANLYAFSFDHFVDPDGHAIVIYMMYNTITDTLDINVSGMSLFAHVQGWSNPLLVSTGEYNGFPRGCISYNSGTIYAGGLWLNYNGSNTIIEAQVGFRITFTPPTNLQVVQGVNNFYLFDEYYNTLSWTASTHPTTTNYLIFRNGILISNVPSTILEYVDDNQVENGAVTYGVAAVDSNRYQSNITTVNFP